MIYAVEIATGEPSRQGREAWVDRTRSLHARHRLCEAELFERIESIRDASYAYVSLCGWAREEDYREALASGAMDDGFDGCDTERTVFRPLVQLGHVGPTRPGHVWLVNPFEIVSEEIDGALTMWDRAKDHMTAQDGFVNARLFRARSPDAKYGLLNVSQWGGARQFKEALADRAYDRHRERSLSYKMHPSLCRRAFNLGEAAARRPERRLSSAMA